MTYEELTPTQQLILEVLAARWRVGDDECWTFESNVIPQLRVLQGLGLVWWKNGIIQRTALAGLTEAGKAMVLSPDYDGKGRKYERSEAATF